MRTWNFILNRAHKMRDAAMTLKRLVVGARPGLRSSCLCLLLVAGLLSACSTDLAALPVVPEEEVVTLPEATPDDEVAQDAGIELTLSLSEAPPAGQVTTLADQLRELGVNVTEMQTSPRQLSDGVFARDDYGPFGRSVRLAPKEIFGAGIGSDCALPGVSPSADPRLMTINIYDPVSQQLRPRTLCTDYERSFLRPSFGQKPDGGRLHPGTQSTRAIVTGDFTGDGLEEGVVLNAYQRATDGSWWLRSRVYKSDSGFTQMDGEWLVGLRNLPIGQRSILDIEAVSGDFSGNGHDDIILAVLTEDFVSLFLILQTSAGRFSTYFGDNNNIDVRDLSGTLSVRLAAGNIDTDPYDELVVLVRAWHDRLSGGRPTGEVRYYVFDNLRPSSFQLELLSSNSLTYQDPRTARTRNVLTADVAIGDFDGDGLGEIAFAGIGEFVIDYCDSYTYTYSILNDAAHGFNELVNTSHRAVSPGCAGELPGYIYSVMANALDYTGDYVKELQANERILKLEDKQLIEIAQVDVIPRLKGAHFSEATFAVTVGDVNNNAQDNVMRYSSYDGQLVFSGKNPPPPLRFKPSDESYPLLAALDLDLDGMTLQYNPGSHRLEFSEPLILAAIAVPPYSVDYGQNPEAATTSYGTSTTAAAIRETTLSFSISNGFGVQVGTSLGPFSFSGEYKHTMDYWIDRSSGTAYETTHTYTFTTQRDDAVVFTSIPYDLYDYTITSSYDPQIVGDTLTFMFARRPFTRIVSKDYYNARVPAGHLAIDERVFEHTAGDVSSYMSFQEKQALRSRVLSDGLHTNARLFLESGTRTVGQGLTSTTVSIELSEQDFYREAFGEQRSHSVSFTGGVVVSDFSVGNGQENALTLSTGRSTIVSSTVPSVTISDNNPAIVYDYGMMTYMQSLLDDRGRPGQAFQVINFWTR